MGCLEVNVYVKTASEPLEERLENVIHCVIQNEQAAYLSFSRGKCIRLIDNLPKFADHGNLDEFFLATNIEKRF